jgi:hypothetical protein
MSTLPTHAAGNACEGLTLIIVELKGSAEDLAGGEDIRQRHLAL